MRGEGPHFREHGRKSCPRWQQRAHLRHTHETPQVTHAYSGSGLGPRLAQGRRRGQRQRRSRPDSHFFMPVWLDFEEFRTPHRIIVWRSGRHWRRVTEIAGGVPQTDRQQISCLSTSQPVFSTACPCPSLEAEGKK